MGEAAVVLPTKRIDIPPSQTKYGNEFWEKMKPNKM